jgi:[ribosomal protein S5]-alanine N-acetyltransferase
MDAEKLFLDSPTFETERLLLRRVSLKDVQEYYEFASNPRVTVHTKWNAHQTIEESEQYIRNVIKKYENMESYHWGIIHKASNRLIGRTGIFQFDISNQKAEIGFGISSEYWNQGIITEATKEIIKYGFLEINLNRIEGRCNHDNIGSGRAMEKLGMIQEGILREQLKIKGKFVDQRMYSIIKSDFARSFEEGSSFR